MDRYRISPNDWTRTRKLHFDRVIFLILKAHKHPMQNALNTFFKEIDEIENVPTASAYSQARNKLNPDIYKEMNDLIINDFYSLYQDDGLNLWKGKRVVGIDGSCFNLPNTEETRENYSPHSSRKEMNIEDKPVLGQGSFLYDVLNDFVLNAEVDKKGSEVQFVLRDHFQFLTQDDIVCLDRGYAAYELMVSFIQRGINFVIRFPTQSGFKKVEDFLNSRYKDKIITLEVPSHKKKSIKDLGLPLKIQVRFVKIKLPSGEIEVLGTNLFDKNFYSIEDLGELYFLRWKEEIYFDNLKNILEIERFSSSKEQYIKQDFYGTIFLSSLESILSKQANIELKIESTIRNREYNYKVNQSICYSTIQSNLAELFFLRKRSLDNVLDEITFLLKKNAVPERRGRHNKRKFPHTYRKWKHEKYKKRIVA